MAKRQSLLDAIFICRVDDASATKVSAAFRAFGFGQMTPAGAGAQHLARRRNLKPLRGRFLGLDAFWTSHKRVSFSSKKSAQYRGLENSNQELFVQFPYGLS